MERVFKSLATNFEIHLGLIFPHPPSNISNNNHSDTNWSKSRNALNHFYACLGVEMLFTKVGRSSAPTCFIVQFISAGHCLMQLRTVENSVPANAYIPFMSCAFCLIKPLHVAGHNSGRCSCATLKLPEELVQAIQPWPWQEVIL